MAAATGVVQEEDPVLDQALDLVAAAAGDGNFFIHFIFLRS
jgi:hypothetical protein